MTCGSSGEPGCALTGSCSAVLLGDRVRNCPRFPGSVCDAWGTFRTCTREPYFHLGPETKGQLPSLSEPHHKGDLVRKHQRSKMFFARGLGGLGLKGPFPSKLLRTLLEVQREASCPSWLRAAGQEEPHRWLLWTGFTS